MVSRADQISQALGSAEKNYQLGQKSKQEADQAKEKARDREFQLVKEKAEVLDGTRTANAMPRAAVRIEDLAALYNFPTSPTARKVTSAPTMAEFNALVEDNRKLYEVLGTIAAALGRRLL